MGNGVKALSPAELDRGDERYLILETKGYDPLREVKRQAADRWNAAVSASSRVRRRMTNG